MCNSASPVATRPAAPHHPNPYFGPCWRALLATCLRFRPCGNSTGTRSLATRVTTADIACTHAATAALRHVCNRRAADAAAARVAPAAARHVCVLLRKVDCMLTAKTSRLPRNPGFARWGRAFSAQAGLAVPSHSRFSRGRAILHLKLSLQEPGHAVTFGCACAIVVDDTCLSVSPALRCQRLAQMPRWFAAQTLPHATCACSGVTVNCVAARKAGAASP